MLDQGDIHGKAALAVAFQEFLGSIEGVDEKKTLGCCRAMAFGVFLRDNVNARFVVVQGRQDDCFGAPVRLGDRRSVLFDTSLRVFFINLHDCIAGHTCRFGHALQEFCGFHRITKATGLCPF